MLLSNFYYMYLLPPEPYKAWHTQREALRNLSLSMVAYFYDNLSLQSLLLRTRGLSDITVSINECKSQYMWSPDLCQLFTTDVIFFSRHSQHRHIPYHAFFGYVWAFQWGPFQAQDGAHFHLQLLIVWEHPEVSELPKDDLNVLSCNVQRRYLHECTHVA